MKSYFIAFVVCFLCYYGNTFAQSSADASIDCKKNKKNQFLNIVQEPINFAWNDEYITATELKYQCVKRPFLSGKIAHNLNGIWDESILLAADRVPFLVWKNRRLIKNVAKNFTIITSGIKSKHSFTSTFIVIDENYNDMLAEDSPYREALIQIFTQNIDVKEHNFRDFFEDLKKAFPNRYNGTEN